MYQCSCESWHAMKLANVLWRQRSQHLSVGPHQISASNKPSEGFRLWYLIHSTRTRSERYLPDRGSTHDTASCHNEPQWQCLAGSWRIGRTARVGLLRSAWTADYHPYGGKTLFPGLRPHSCAPYCPSTGSYQQLESETDNGQLSSIAENFIKIHEKRTASLKVRNFFTF